jgi:hypothetical protein
MIFRADPSAVRSERGGRVGVSMFKVLETQGSIGNHLLCALQKNLRVFVYENLSLPLKRWYMSAINELIMLTSYQLYRVSTQRAMVRQLKWFSQEMTE